MTEQEFKYLNGYPVPKPIAFDDYDGYLNDKAIYGAGPGGFNSLYVKNQLRNDYDFITAIYEYVGSMTEPYNDIIRELNARFNILENQYNKMLKEQNKIINASNDILQENKRLKEELIAIRKMRPAEYYKELW